VPPGQGLSYIMANLGLSLWPAALKLSLAVECHSVTGTMKFTGSGEVSSINDMKMMIKENLQICRDLRVMVTVQQSFSDTDCALAAPGRGPAGH
jgi:hypothetical protein